MNKPSICINRDIQIQNTHREIGVFVCGVNLDWIAVKLITNGGRKILESIGSETEKETALANSRIPNHQQLEQVIKLCLTR